LTCFILLRISSGRTNASVLWRFCTINDDRVYTMHSIAVIDFHDLDGTTISNISV